MDDPLPPGRTDLAPDSASLLPAFRGEQLEEDAPALRPAVVHHSQDGMFALREGPWKLVEGLGSGGFTRPQREEQRPGEPPGRLYHLWDDPKETTNLWTQRPDVVESLSARLTTFRRGGTSNARIG